MNQRAQARQISNLRPGLSREFILAHKRRRIMDAIAELCAEQGYEATTIEDIARRAGVARKTLYENFSGKEEIFLTTFDAALDEALRRVEGACAEVEGDWEKRIEVGLAAFLGYVAEQPALARMCMIEAPAITRAATQRYEEAMQRFVELTRHNLPRSERLPETIDETLIGGVAWIVNQQIRRDETEQAEDLLPELAEFVAAPFLHALQSGPESVRAR